jgi:hypothetical protein
MSSEALARRREFKLAMRQRIREVAVSRGLSEEDIKPALTLKHRHIAEFSKSYSVSLAWLFEGKGRSEDFAAAVLELPIDAQRAIAAKIREMRQGPDETPWPIADQEAQP